MSELGKKLAVANFNSGRYQIRAGLCNTLTEEATEIMIKVPGDDPKSFFYELDDIGLSAKDVVVWMKYGKSEVAHAESLHSIGDGKSKYTLDTIDHVLLTKEGVQKMVLAGVKHPVLDAYAEHFQMQQPKNHSDRLK